MQNETLGFADISLTCFTVLDQLTLACDVALAFLKGLHGFNVCAFLMAYG